MCWEKDMNPDVDVNYRIRNPFADDRFFFFSFLTPTPIY